MTRGDDTGTARSRGEFSILDWIGVIVSCVVVACVFAMPFVQDRIDAMYREFGAADLPALTKVAVGPWFARVIALAATAGIAVGVTTRRRWPVIAAFLIAGAGFAIMLIGFYLPIFRLAGSVR